MKTKAILFTLIALVTITVLVFQSCQKDEEKINQRPTCKITSPTSGQKIQKGETITISVDADDRDGNLKKVLLAIDGIEKGSASSSPFNYNWSTISESYGPHILKATSIDNSGDSASNEITIEITGNLLAEKGHSPAWSPDGKEIAFINDHSLYLMNSDGSNKRELATDIMEAPIWSPSGDYILYIGYSVSTLYVLVRLDANGDNRTILCGDTTMPRLASWSPDGQQIVFITWNGPLCVINADGTNFHTLTTGVHTPETPRWSPDMNTLLFTKGADDDRDMYFINSDGSNLTRLPIDSLYETGVKFSIDGTKVFFTAHPILGSSHNIYSVNCDGSGFVNLTASLGGGGGTYLSPDGTEIAFIGSWDGETALYIMASDGSGQQRMVGLFDGISGISWSPDGKEIAFRSDQKIYSIRVDQ